MLKEQAGKVVELSHQANSTDLEQQQYELVREVYRTIHLSPLNQFTYSAVDSLWADLDTIVYQLEHLPEAAFKELLAAIEGLTEARNELRLARFLFDVEEIDPLYRLILRNRAMLRGEHILEKVIKIWPIPSSLPNEKAG